MPLQTANQFQLVPEISRLGAGIQQGQQIAQQFQLGQQRDVAAQREADKARVLSVVDGALKIQALPTDEAKRIALENRAEQLRANNIDDSDTQEMLRLFKGDQSDIDQAKSTMDAIVSSAERAGIIKSKSLAAKAPKAFEKTASGLVFNPNTGVYTVDEVAKARIDKLRAKSDVTKLDFKDKQGLNKDVTSIIKDTVGIKRAATELEKLKGIGSPAAKLGAVFKFMKALDPTSVVRESEQGQVYAASGAASQIAGSINSLLGEGKLTEKGFADLVATSKGIADANISSVNTELENMLGSFGDTLPLEFKAGLLKRIPKQFGAIAAKSVPAQSYTSSTGINFTVE